MVSLGLIVSTDGTDIIDLLLLPGFMLWTNASFFDVIT
jgi:hypothetical protein